MSMLGVAARRATVGVLAAWLTMPIVACSKESVDAREPAGSSRQAKPQVIIKKEDVLLDGHLIQLHKTTAAEVKSRIGIDPSDQASADAYWNETGIVIFATPRDDLPGRPNLVHSFRVWLRQEVDLQKSRSCTSAEQVEHQESV